MKCEVCKKEFYRTTADKRCPECIAKGAFIPELEEVIKKEDHVKEKAPKKKSSRKK